ncbi:MAG: ABC transporter substrate-binding protein [Roseburia sp.]|nr:ABC transporter substrate-binding protein [Roseburia sp.]
MKKEFLKRVMATSLVAAMALSTAACGGGSSDSAADTKTDAAEDKAEEPAADAAEDKAEEPAADAASGESNGDYEECKLTISWWGGDSRHEATQKAIEAFQTKYPGITVEATYGAWDGWEEKMATAFSAGSAQDVNQINWNWITQYDSDGSTFLNMDDYKDVFDQSQVDSKWLEMCKASDGSLAGIPISMTGRIFYWDKTTFDEVGVALPTSLEDLKAAGEAFKAKGDDYYPLCLGEYDRMILMVYYLESKYGKDWVTGSTLNYSKEEIVDGLEFIQSLEDAHVIPSIATIAGDGASSIDQNPKWIDGRYAGIWEWDSSASKFSDAAEGREIVVGDYFSDFGDNKGGFAKVSMCWAVNAKTEHPKEAAMLVEYLMNDEEAAKILTSERGIPVSKSALAASQADLNATVVEANGKVLSWVSNNFDPYFEDAKLKNSPDGVYYDALGGLSYGDYDVDAAADVLMDGINGVISGS